VAENAPKAAENAQKSAENAQKSAGDAKNPSQLIADAKDLLQRLDSRPDFGQNVDDFLLRMRRDRHLEVTFPQLPKAKSLNSVFTAENTRNLTQNLDEEEENSLSESKFRRGLEASIYFTSEDENKN